MDKRLIDADKLLEWLEKSEEADKFWTTTVPPLEKFDLIEDAINEGKFDPDPAPVPTIKPGDKVRRCYHCNETSSDRDWDLATEKKCGYPITRINEAPGEGAFFICPKCGKKSDYELLEVSHD